MKKHFFKKINKIYLILIPIGLVVIIMLVFIPRQNEQENIEDENTKFFNSFDQIQIVDGNSSKENQILENNNRLVEISEDGKAVTATIEDPEHVATYFDFFSKAYKGDIIIATPQNTIILDSNNNIRDISSNPTLFEAFVNKKL